MLSPEFSAEIRPEQQLRDTVMLSGALAALVGFILIIHLSLHPLLRLGLVFTWLASVGVDLWQLSRCAATVVCIGINRLGEVWVVDAAGRRQPVTLLPGSIVLTRFAWLRIRLNCGRKYGELVRGNIVEDRQWHRFQLIWKQARQIIGHTGGS